MYHLFSILSENGKIHNMGLKHLLSTTRKHDLFIMTSTPVVTSSKGTSTPPNNQLLDYFQINGVILILAFLQHQLIYYNVSSVFEFLLNTTLFFLKNYIMLILIDLGTKNKKYISPQVSPVDKFNTDSVFYVSMASLLESFTLFLALKYLLLYSPMELYTTNYLSDLLLFIPIAFTSEIIFDLFHYWAHRMSHTNKLLYSLHKEHHAHRYPTSVTTFYQHPVDLMISNSLPSLLTALIVRPSLFQISLLGMYKTFLEIGGHCGKALYPTASFPQCPWIPKMLDIQLHVEDHNVHHTHVKCNYAKRFSLWDKWFGTYLKVEENN
jgi:sterol desaturase/sphingolipid hydroxylase (fatty acid hydroxylase superfamily)